MKILKVSDFYDDPHGRYYTDGDGSGEEFREEVLVPILKTTKGILKINIDENIEGYGSSFLSEAFGAIVKLGYFTSFDLLQRIEIKFEDEDFKFFDKKIKQYIEDAKHNSQAYVSTKKEAEEKKVYKGYIDKKFVNDFLGK